MTTFAMASTLTPPTSTAPRSAWILQDGPKRGVGLEISGQPIEATLPVELEEDLEIAITYGKSSRRTWVQRDLLYLLVGRRGRLRITRPGIDVATDTIAVHADEATARELATSVGATLVEARRGWLLNGPDVLYELAYTAIPPGKLVVQPVSANGKRRRIARKRPGVVRHRERERQERVAATPFAQRDDVPWTVPVAQHPAAEDLSSSRPPELAGWVCDSATCHVLGIDGFAHRCQDDTCDEAGTWHADPDGLVIDGRLHTWSAGLLQPAGPEANDVR
jgi:hypothetical protein